MTRIPTGKEFIAENIVDTKSILHSDRRRCKHAFQTIKEEFEAIIEKRKQHKRLTMNEKLILSKIDDINLAMEKALPID